MRRRMITEVVATGTRELSEASGARKFIAIDETQPLSNFKATSLETAGGHPRPLIAWSTTAQTDVRAQRTVSCLFPYD